MAVALTIFDAEDGTGGTATIAGSPAGSTNTLYRAPFSGDYGTLTWTQNDVPIVGDGTIAIVSPSPTALGYYLWRLNSVAAGVLTQVEVFQKISRDLELPGKIYDAVELRVKALGLISNSSVVPLLLPRKVKGVDPDPCIQICPGGTWTFPVVLCSKDDIVVPVLVAILDTQSSNFIRNKDRNLGWRWDILSAFRYQRLAGVTEVNTCLPIETEDFDRELFQKNVFYSELKFGFITRTVRG